MSVFWGLLTMAAGALLFALAHTESRFIVYRLLVARSRILWGDNVYRFHKVSGTIVVIVGLLMATGVLS